jgi:glutamate racemase
MKHKTANSPIGIFDSGYGGLTVLKEIVKELPQYSYIYLGDNARAPYGKLSFETVYEYTLQCVKWLFDKNCKLVILACNTASAKALRNIQQKDLNHFGPEKRVLGVIRPTAEVVGKYSQSKHIGVFGTNGTVSSNSYPIEINKLYPDLIVHQEACPQWVDLVERNNLNSPETDFQVKKHINNLLAKSSEIDTIILGCTHYPLLENKIRENLSSEIKIISQGEIVAKSLTNYLVRHPELESECRKESEMSFYTTGNVHHFNESASIFFGKKILANQIKISNKV